MSEDYEERQKTLFLLKLHLGGILLNIMCCLPCFHQVSRFQVFPLAFFLHLKAQ